MAAASRKEQLAAAAAAAKRELGLKSAVHTKAAVQVRFCIPLVIVLAV